MGTKPLVVSITALTAGFLGGLVGVIATFSNAFDTQTTLTGIAVSLLSIAYALMIILLIIPISLRNQAK
ncbi:hypothetical protein VAEKB19_2520003 [Vibrio aestuarianus]|nr:hypothetical protein VAEKB19_2520003 [Vibrio aestuarianus]